MRNRISSLIIYFSFAKNYGNVSVYWLIRNIPGCPLARPTTLCADHMLLTTNTRSKIIIFISSDNPQREIGNATNHFLCRKSWPGYTERHHGISVQIKFKITDAEFIIFIKLVIMNYIFFLILVYLIQRKRNFVFRTYI